MTDPVVERPRLELRELTPYLVVVGMAAVMWIVELVDLLPHTRFDHWGIRPRQLGGLTGIPAAPFLHDGLGHLIGNTIPFLVLGCIIAASGTRRFIQVTVIVGVTAGLGTWLVGPAHTVHIGASGLVFGYLTYLVTRGFFERHLGQVVVGLVVLFFYGSILWGLLPRPGISWQGHAFGALGGVLAAWVIHGRGRSPATTPAPEPPSPLLG
ncbi:MAG TPA: rhomboid family intramembrane serine protease [Acidimicrobiales bacterium]|jgi:membrane associated rhomboid family serine protease|nr:rhomboid family intramembrane serine protease [Acidimicrobiales bacterium]